MGFSRLPNGLGTISKLKQNLRKPYRARKLVGEQYDEATKNVRRIYRTIGYFKTKKDALEALMSDGGVSEGGDMVTLQTVYDAWSAKKFPELSESSAGNYRNSFIVFSPLSGKKFSTIRPKDYESLVTERVTDSRARMCKILLNQLYSYAIRNEIVDKDYSVMVDFGHRNHQKKERRVFTPEEVRSLWEKQGDPYADVILVLLYTGFRIMELITIDKEKMRDGCFVGGLKTENGRNRLVPIHPDILPIVERNARKSAKLKSTSLFCDDNGNPITMNQMKWRLPKLCPGHILHETRHSFATYAKKSGMDLLATKRILGHSVKDLTEGTYTHLDIDMLKGEMGKYRIE